MKTMKTRSKVSAARPVLILFLLLVGLMSIAQSSTSMCRLAVQLLLNGNSGAQNMADGVVVLFDSSFSRAVGPEDSYKFNNMDENLAVYRNGTLLSVEGRPLIAKYDTIPLRIWKYRQSTYCIKFIPNFFCDSIVAFLKDNYTQQDIPIDLTAPSAINYTLTSDSASFAPDRLCIVFRPATTMSLGISSVNAMLKQNGVQVDWSVPTSGAYDNYTIQWSASGLQFIDVATVEGGSRSSSNFQWFDVSPEKGNNYYRIRTTSKTGAFVYSPVVKVVVGKANKGISVYPNPVTSRALGLQLNDLAEGEYTIILVNNAGLPVYKSAFRHQGGNSSRSLQINTTLPKGSYVLQVTGAGSVFSTSVLCN